MIDINNFGEVRVWVERDLAGSAFVMLQYQDGHSTPFCYCGFHYDYRLPNALRAETAAVGLAQSLGAPDPVPVHARPFQVPIPTPAELVNMAIAGTTGLMMMKNQRSKDGSPSPLSELPDDTLDIARSQLAHLVIEIEAEQEMREIDYRGMAAPPDFS